jgi:Domain of unknown function (DUF4395)
MLVGIGERLFGTTAHFRGGVPKQFAQFIGVMFSGLGAAFLLADAGALMRIACSVVFEVGPLPQCCAESQN